jgi:hypothetical protein
MKSTIEYTIITPNTEQHFGTKVESKMFWSELDEQTKAQSQYFSKKWVSYAGGDFEEGEVILLN